MTRRAALRLEAELEVLHAVQVHEHARRGYGAKFLDQFEACLVRIEDAPLSFPEVEGGVRRALMNRFRYAVFFRVLEEDAIDVLAVLHQHQAEDTWRER